MNRNLLSRSEALNQGLYRYFTGKPCKHGHFSDRYTATASCCMCLLQHQRMYKRRINEAKVKDAMGFREMTIRVPNESAPFVREFEEMLAKTEMYPRLFADTYGFLEKHMHRILYKTMESTEITYPKLIEILKIADVQLDAIFQAYDLTSNG